MQRLILKSFQSPGDIVMLTAALRDLHVAHPERFQTDVRTSADALFEQNPRITRLRERDAGVQTLEMHYPLIHQSNHLPFHFLHGYVQFLEARLGVKIPLTAFRGDIHLSEAERQQPPPGHHLGVPANYWIVMAGGKFDFTAKWWNPASYQAVVDHFLGKIAFVQCGEAGHWHPPLKNVVPMVGKTTLRDFVRLVYHADGVLCPVTFAMHLAAAVPTKPGKPRHRPCVVVAGGREPPHWEAYPQHRFLHTVGTLSCCIDGGCWKSRCQPVGDGDEKDRRDLCDRPVQVTPDLRIPLCQELILPADVIREIDRYYQGGVMKYADGTTVNGHSAAPAIAAARNRGTEDQEPAGGPLPRVPVLIEFRHGLGDAVQFTLVLKHLYDAHPEWDIDVAALPGKHTAFHGLCRRALVIDRDPIERSRYRQVYSLDWHECRTDEPGTPNTKPVRCLREVFRLSPKPELCRYSINAGPAAREAARTYLSAVCPQGPDGDGRFPVVLVHYQGNTSADRKNLSHELIREVCDVILQQKRVPVILDWDRRSPLPDGARIHCPDVDHPLWRGLGTGDAETLAALIEASSLLIGVDSGPLHVAGATSTPTLAVWTHHHPIHYFDFADNTLHLVPDGHQAHAAGPNALRCFEQAYRHQTYRQLSDLPAHVESALTGEKVELITNRRFLSQLTATVYGELYYEEHKRGGLDYLHFGEWQKTYGRWLVESLGLQGKRVLDVGCACGAIVRGLGDAGAIVQGVDVNEHMIHLGRQQWPEMSRLLFTCDAVNLHPFANGSFDAVHTSQVAEHWKPALVPHILDELRRVTKPGGLLFCALDTEELFARQGRRLDTDDPTHVCIRPLAWWHERLREHGWEAGGGELREKLLSHAESYLKLYDWDWFLARRV